MPFINVKANTPISAEQKTAIKSALGEAIATIPGKSEGWLMVGIEPEYTLFFKGSDAPAAMVEVSVYGKANPTAFDELTGKICSILNEQLSIDSARIYVKYSATADWGWNGSNF